MPQPRILIVEDEPIVARDIRVMLESMEYAVIDMVNSGEQALVSAETHLPDLVLMDMMLAGEMDGISAAAQIGGELHIPVVFLTAYSDEETLNRAKQSEPYGYVLKPFNERDLRIAVEIALYKHEMENRLKESERWFGTTLGSIGEAVIATGIDDRVKYMNPAAEKLTGVPAAEATGLDLAAVLHSGTHSWDDAVAITGDSLPPLESPRDQRGKFIVKSRAGGEKYVEFTAAMIRDEGGNPIGGVLALRDISRRKAAEKELKKHRDHLEEMVRERTLELTMANTKLEKAREMAESALSLIHISEPTRPY